MSKLHLISKALELKPLQSGLSRYASNDEPLLFIGDSVTTLLDGEVIKYLSQHRFNINVLEADCACRGISHLIVDSIITISDQQMVELTLKHPKIVSW
jgi:sulfur relay protein TusB/DsrH